SSGPGHPAPRPPPSDTAKQALDATPADHPVRARYLSNLTMALLAQFHGTGRLADLDAAVRVGQQAVDAAPADHPERALAVGNLAAALQVRYERFRRAGDLEAVIGRWREAAEVDAGSPGIRMSAARAWGQFAFEAGDVNSAADGYAAGVELLPQVAWHGLDRATQEEQLAGWAGLAAAAAACAVGAGQLARAVEVLEQGRAVLWTQALHLRTDLARLRDHAPALADRLDEVRRELDQPSPGTALGGLAAPAASGSTAAVTAHDQAIAARRQLAREWDDLVARVRRL